MFGKRNSKEMYDLNGRCIAREWNVEQLEDKFHIYARLFIIRYVKHLFIKLNSLKLAEW